MLEYQKEFLLYALRMQALKFGNFTLKSGRKSPYFFNTSFFNSGESISMLGKFYAAVLKNSKISFDGLFGPAYKGIPLAISTSIALSENFDKSVSWSFNRKESKTHGEGGMIVGSPLTGKVIIIDDVLTSGKAIVEAINIITNSDAKLCGCIIGLDRQEKDPNNDKSAVKNIEDSYGIPVLNIANISDLISFSETEDQLRSYADKIRIYQASYGVN